MKTDSASAQLKSFDSRADWLAADFARRRGLSIDDPIVKRLRVGIKRAIGYRRWRNGVEADRKDKQPNLFSEPKKPTEIGGAQ